MTRIDQARRQPADPVAIPALGPPACCSDGSMVVTRHRQVRAVLSDPGFEVPAAAAARSRGTIGWLRASVSRFANGSDHARRRAKVIAELEGLPPAALRTDAEKRAHAVITSAAGSGRLDVMARLARRVPMAVLAARLGLADADGAAEAVIATAAAYFPGAGPERERTADIATAELVRALGPEDEEIIVAKIALMVQGCDATAGLIGKAIHRALLLSAEQNSAWSTGAILAEVLRHDPPIRVTRRISRPGAELDGCRIPAGGVVFLQVDAANRDPAVFGVPDQFDPGRSECSSLTFGYGLRPCPGQGHALMLAAGVVQAVRDRCVAVVGPVEYEPPVNVRVPAKLEVILR
jgi:cytochrome P450